MKIRLDRWLSTLAVDSRSRVKDMIRKGAAAVNGVTVRDPAFSCSPESDELKINGTTVDGRICRHVMLHKPAGILTAARDPKQPTVMDLFPPVYASIGCMPVGRLDKDTTGLLVLTCDGEMNHRLLSPGRHVDKRYRAVVEGKLTEKETAVFAAGLELSDFTALPATLTILQAGEKTSVAEVVIREGKYHQVRRMFGAVGHEVLELHRMSFGTLALDESLPEGAWRELTETELAALKKSAAMEEI